MSKDYKNTLLMMNTSFKMKGNLAEKEPLMEATWEQNKIYEKALEKNKNNKHFILHDGPPYANGDIHIGHALNKVLKDFIVRYKTMDGFYAPYVPGWDTHGLPIENALTKNGKVNRKELSIAEFRTLCEEYAKKQIENQKIGFKRLGILGDWDNPYITYDKEYEAKQLEVFAKMVSKKLIYKGLKPVYWSPSSESALAEAEIEYQDVKSPSIYLAFKVTDGKGVLDNGTEIVIWTTTPWTIPANLATCVHADYTYVVINANLRKLVVAKELLKEFTEKLEIKDFKILKELKGKDLEFVEYIHPLYNRTCPIILGDHVTLESGTGLVHTAPGHGEDDFVVGKKYGLGILCPVDERGYMTKEAGEFAGLFYDDANKEITKKLEEVGSLLSLSFFTHSYPHDWRTNKPVIYRATEQWFASIEALKEDMLKSVAKVKWYPSWGETRITNMIKDRKEWCISRQRVWGVPIPVFYGEDGEAIIDSDLILHVSKIFEKEGSNAWFNKDAKDLLPKGYTNVHSPNGIFKKETDIMDVWFDSGSSHHAVLDARGLDYPADVYLEGSDQYRGWFNSSLSTGVAMQGTAPYKAVITHGFVLDGNGRKMSKSLGNAIDPGKVSKQYGSDILRLWVSSVDYNSDVRISNDLLIQAAESYRKIRNTFRFLLGNISDFNYKDDQIIYEEMGEVDQYMISLLNKLIDNVRKAYEEYRFSDIYHLVLSYMTNDLSAFYLDFTKDILYIDSKSNPERRSIQTVFYLNLINLIKLLTPIIPHTTEEVYSHMQSETQESVYLTDMPKPKQFSNSEELLHKYKKFKSLRDDVLKALEEARNEKIIGKSLSSKVVLKPSKETREIIDNLNCDFKKIFIVSEFVVTDEDIEGQKFSSGIINVTARKGIVCDRCWQVVDEVNEDRLCTRCVEVIKNLEEK
ncbi:MAG TPA: isoleucine--tRNA ligase [Acholeplasmataceae bacterium]|nr:isoleucine--tRNA ligase [Acholeplasmataceae bacterium]